MSPDDRHKSMISKALSVVPAAAVVAVVVSSYFARAPDIIAARVYGGPPGPDHTLAWRIVVSLRDRGFYEPVRDVPIVIDASSADPVRGRTDDEGAWEARIPLGADAPAMIDVEVRRDDSGQSLWSGPIAVRPPSWEDAFHTAPAKLPGRTSGELDVEVSLQRAVVAASYPERARVRVSRDSDPVAADLTLTGDGVVFDDVDAPRTNDRGEAWITLRPTFSTASVTIEARDEGGDVGRIQCPLPVRTGALWVDPAPLADGTIVVSSPVGRRHAYLTWFSKHARLGATRLVLEADGRSGAQGRMALPRLPDAPVWLMISPDPPGTGEEPGLLGWPVQRTWPHDPCPAAHASTVKLADGMPRALEQARRRAHAGRLRAMILLALAALIESALLWTRARHARLELERLLASHADIDEAVSRALVGGSRFWVRMLVATLLVAVGFSALALVIWLGAS